MTDAPVGDRPATVDRILDAAEDCIRVLGLRRTSMVDVAERAAVSRGSVYRYFPDRDALVDGVLARVADRFVDASAPVVARRRTLATQVAEAAVFVCEHTADDAVTLGVKDDDQMLALVLAARADRLVERWVEFWVPHVAAAEARGEVRAGLDHRQVGEWIVRVLVSFPLMPSVAVDLGDPRAVRRFVTDHLVAGLAP